MLGRPEGKAGCRATEARQVCKRTYTGPRLGQAAAHCLPHGELRKEGGAGLEVHQGNSSVANSACPLHGHGQPSEQRRHTHHARQGARSLCGAASLKAANGPAWASDAAPWFPRQAHPRTHPWEVLRSRSVAMCHRNTPRQEEQPFHVNYPVKRETHHYGSVLETFPREGKPFSSREMKFHTKQKAFWKYQKIP